MNSIEIQARLNKLGTLFNFNQLKSPLTPIVDITFVSPENAFTMVSFCTFFNKPGRRPLSEVPGQQMVIRISEIKNLLINKIPFTAANHSISEGLIKTKIIKTNDGNYLVITVTSSFSEDQDLLIKEIEVILAA